MNWDDDISHWINSLSGHFSALDEGLRLVSLAGPALLVFAISLRWWSRVERETQRYLAITCGVSTSLGLLLNQAILLVYHRVRPYDAGVTRLIIERSADPSFPSDHATVGFAIAACLLLSKDRQRHIFLLSALLLSISRVYVGTHYVTDVLGGATTGITGAIVAVRFQAVLLPLTRKLVRVL